MIMNTLPAITTAEMIAVNTLIFIEETPSCGAISRSDHGHRAIQSNKHCRAELAVDPSPLDSAASRGSICASAHSGSQMKDAIWIFTIKNLRLGRYEPDRDEPEFQHREIEIGTKAWPTRELAIDAAQQAVVR
jgi:hypothetical protein